MECLLMLVLAGAGGSTGAPGPAPDVDEAFSRLPERLRISLDWVEAAPAANEPTFAFDRLELTPSLGMLLYSSEWEADPAFCVGVQALLPAPGILDGLGAFFQISVSQLDRDIDTLTHKDDTAFFAAIGADYTFFQNKTFRAHAQTALLYGNFGEVSDTEDGISFVLGVSGALRLSKGLWISYNPQFGFADDSEWLFFHHLGLTITF